jgi:hypothetical protein
MPSNLDKFDHLVVLMLENRSFDNMLGWLYDPNNAPPFDKAPGGQTFNGVSGKDLSSPIPDYAQGAEKHRFRHTVKEFFETKAANHLGEMLSLRAVLFNEIINFIETVGWDVRAQVVFKMVVGASRRNDRGARECIAPGSQKLRKRVQAVVPERQPNDIQYSDE